MSYDYITFKFLQIEKYAFSVLNLLSTSSNIKQNNQFRFSLKTSAKFCLSVVFIKNIKQLNCSNSPKLKRDLDQISDQISHFFAVPQKVL